MFLPPDKLASRTTKARATKFMRHPRHQMPNPDSSIAEMNRNKTPWSPPGHWLLPLPVQPTFVRSFNMLLLCVPASQDSQGPDLSPRDPFPLCAVTKGDFFFKDFSRRRQAITGPCDVVIRRLVSCDTPLVQSLLHGRKRPAPTFKSVQHGGGRQPRMSGYVGNFMKAGIDGLILRTPYTGT